MLRRDCPASDAGVAGVDAANYIPIAIASAARVRVASAGNTISHLTSLASASLTPLGGLPLLLPLAALTGLSIAGEGSGLELLAGGLTWLARRVGTLAEPGELVAQTGQIIHGAIQRRVL